MKSVVGVAGSVTVMQGGYVKDLLPQTEMHSVSGRDFFSVCYFSIDV